MATNFIILSCIIEIIMLFAYPLVDLSLSQENAEEVEKKEKIKSILRKIILIPPSILAISLLLHKIISSISLLTIIIIIIIIYYFVKK